MAGARHGVTVDGIKWFRGIPYGADTSGRNQFMPPQEVAAWSGVRDCTGMPAWDAYNPSQRGVMVFDGNTRQVNDPQREIRLMWDRILTG